MKKIITLTICLLGIVQFNFSQYYYIPASTPGNPGGLNTDNEYPSGSGLPAGWSVILGPSNSSPTWSTVENIGFPFNFNGNSVTQYKVSSTGVLTFSTGASNVPSPTNAALPDPGIPDNSIMVWGLQGTGSNDNIVTKTFGTAGGRQHWVFFSSYTAGSWSYWSIVMEEGTDNIYIVDQRHSTAANPQITAGIQIDGSTATMVAGSPTLSNVAGADATPADNHYYEFIYGSQNATDMAGVSVTTFPYLILGNAPFTISGEVTNYGSSSVTDFDINYSIDGGTTVTENITGVNLNTYDNHTFDHSTLWTPTASGSYSVAIWASNINGSSDMDLNNDTAYATLNVFDNFVQRIPMLEVFTSSTCPPCVQGNINLKNVLSNYNQTDYTLLKYQMSWPGSGDPYYTQEAGDRRTFYGVNSVPRLEIDGGYDGNPSGFTTQEFDESAGIPSFSTISANYSVYHDQGQNSVVDMNVTIDPIEDFNSNDLTLFVAIIEYATYNNTGSNGETEFLHVMKKMIPSSSGTAIPALQAGVQESFNFSYNFQGQYTLPVDANSPINHMNSHSVEDFDNLGVVVWVQDVNTKEVLQSTTASIVANVEENITASRLMIFPNPSSEDYTNLVIESSERGMFEIMIINTLGEIVLMDNVSVSKNLTQYQLDNSKLSNGMYNVIIQTPSIQSSKKLQILR